MGVESICFVEAMHLVRRSPKYWLGTPQMYLASLRNPEQARVFRAAYFFVRHIDDVLDGDRHVQEKPSSYVGSILEMMANSETSPSIQIVELYNFVIGEIDSLKRDGDDPKADFERVIKAMFFDYERSKNPKVFGYKDLERYYSETFAPVINISLIILGSSLRARDMPVMVSAQGHLYSVRDMKKDLKQRIVNIPKEELENASLNGHLSYRDLVRNPRIRHWFFEEVEHYSALLSSYKDELLRDGDPAAQKLCLPLITGMKIFSLWYRLTHSNQ